MPQLPVRDVQEALIERELLTCCCYSLLHWRLGGETYTKVQEFLSEDCRPERGNRAVRTFSNGGDFQARSRQKKWGLGDR